jgi:hypothetical protein
MNDYSHIRVVFVVVVAVLMLSIVGLATAQESGSQEAAPPVTDTTFTYQGQLKNASGPVNGTCDFQFSLWDLPSGFTGQIGMTQSKSSVAVSNGIFAVQLDFGNVFTGETRWLKIAVRCPANSGAYVTLSPRQALTAAPYALGLKPGAIIAQNNFQIPALALSNTAMTYTIPNLYGSDAVFTGSVGLRVSGTMTGIVAIGDTGVITWSDGWYTHTARAGTGVEGIGANVGVAGIGLGGWGAAGGFFKGYEGVHAEGRDIGVHGKSSYVGIRGTNDGTGVGVIGSSIRGAGVTGMSGWGEATLSYYNTGVAGVSVDGPGVYAEGYYSHALKIGSALSAPTATLISVVSKGTSDIMEAYRESNRIFRISYTGTVYADGPYFGAGYYAGGADFAEMLPATGNLEPGDVLVVGSDGQLARCTRAYQSTVVGVYSTQPGFVGGANDGADLNDMVPLAVVGVVPVKVSAENGPIRPGDLLVASSTPGYAMQAGAHPPGGTVIGKALGGLEAGVGVIKLLVMLQ